MRFARFCWRDTVGSESMRAVIPPELDALTSAELKALVTALIERVATLERMVGAQCHEIARLKGLPGRPVLRPSGMERAT